MAEAKKRSATKPRKRAAKKTAAHKSTKPTVLVEGSGKNARVFLETQKG